MMIVNAELGRMWMDAVEAYHNFCLERLMETTKEMLSVDNSRPPSREWISITSEYKA